MSRLRPYLLLLRHGLLLMQCAQLRFRLETFGVYYPSLPYARRGWRMNPKVVLLFIRRTAAYARWLDEINQVRREGAEGWWQERRR